MKIEKYETCGNVVIGRVPNRRKMISSLVFAASISASAFLIILIGLGAR